MAKPSTGGFFPEDTGGSSTEYNDIVLYDNDGTSTTITNNVNSTIEIQSKNDGTIAEGSITAIFTDAKFKYNIPPYRLISIYGKKYVCSSLCSHILSENAYFHSITLMDMTALLSGFIIGTKSFSVESNNPNDWQKAKILCFLANQTYSYRIGIDQTDSELSNLLSNKYYYLFKEGYTLFDCLKEIADKNDCKVIVSDYIPSSKTIKVKFLSLNFNESYALNRNSIVKLSFEQNSEKYGKILTTEAKNVVDRNTISHWDYLTVRSKGTRLCVDYAEMKLPSKVEQIVDFGFNDVQLFCDSSSYIELTTISKDEYNSIISRISSYNTFGSIRNYLNTKYAVDIEKAYTDCFGLVYTDQTDFYAREWSITQGTDHIILYPAENLKWIRRNGEDEEEYPLVQRFSFEKGDTPILLEKSQWELLDESIAYKYPFYTTGSDVIENMDSFYKYDLWHRVLNISGKSFIADIDNTVFVKKYTSTKFVSYAKVFPYIGGNTNSMLHMFYVDAYTMTNPKMSLSKLDTPINESAYLNFASSYGRSDSKIDFDKLTFSMKEDNKSDGLIEQNVTIDCTSASTMPSAGQYIDDTLTGKRWYIASEILTLGLESITADLHLVLNYNKQADSIAVESEFESTKAPQTNIIDRAIEIPISLTMFSDSLQYFAKIEFYETATKKIGTAWKRLSVQVSAEMISLYCEMEDNYSAGLKKKTDATSFTNTENQLVEDVTYVDSFNETLLVKASIYALNSALTMKESYRLPVVDTFTSKFTALSSVKSINIYKDARERLTFTFNHRK